MITQGLLPWSRCSHSLSSLPFLSLSLSIPAARQPQNPAFVASLDSTAAQEELSARERRRLRHERREGKSGYSWREEVEERLVKKPKKRYTSWTEELNLDNLAHLGPQWWVVRVSRVRGLETAEMLARSLARNFPEVEFKVYTPTVQVKRRLKNGTISVKPKQLFPGCVFLRCVLNKHLHDFIRDYNRVGGFVGSKVGNKIRQINKPRPVSVDDIEAIFKQAKEEQEKEDRAFEEAERGEGTVNTEKLKTAGLDSSDATSVSTFTPKLQTRKSSDSAATRKNAKLLKPGSSVRVVSGNFAEFVGNLKKLNRKSRKATVEITLFGKESLVDLDINDIVLENA